MFGIYSEEPSLVILDVYAKELTFKSDSENILSVKIPDPVTNMFGVVTPYDAIVY